MIARPPADCAEATHEKTQNNGSLGCSMVLSVVGYFIACVRRRRLTFRGQSQKEMKEGKLCFKWNQPTSKSAVIVKCRKWPKILHRALQIKSNKREKSWKFKFYYHRADEERPGVGDGARVST